MCLLIAFVGGYYKERVDGHLESGYNAILFFVTLFVVLCAFIILVFVCMCCKEYREKRAKIHANDPSKEEESVLASPYADDVPLNVFTL